MFEVITAAVKAGEAILEIYKTDFNVEIKSDNSPLTVADKKANNIITSYLQKTGIPIISEESKQLPYSERKKWKQCWIVDPLDGTKEFVKRNGEFTVNVALTENGKPQMGVIYVPVTKILYVGLVQKGKSYKFEVNTENFKLSNILSTSNEIKPSLQNDIVRIVGSRSHLNEETINYISNLSDNNKAEMVSIGSSLKFCLVAEGKADLYPRFAPTMEWDTAAGQAICEAVGVSVIDYTTNKPMCYNKENLLNNHFLVVKNDTPIS